MCKINDLLNIKFGNERIQAFFKDYDKINKYIYLSVLEKGYFEELTIKCDIKDFKEKYDVKESEIKCDVLYENNEYKIKDLKDYKSLKDIKLYNNNYLYNIVLYGIGEVECKDEYGIPDSISLYLKSHDKYFKLSIMYDDNYYDQYIFTYKYDSLEELIKNIDEYCIQIPKDKNITIRDLNSKNSSNIYEIKEIIEMMESNKFLDTYLNTTTIGLSSKDFCLILYSDIFPPGVYKNWDEFNTITKNDLILELQNKENNIDR